MSFINTVFSLRDGRSRLAGWMRDPFDEDWKKGVLMSVSELEEFDQFFPGFPLTLCREFIGALIDGSGQ